MSEWNWLAVDQSAFKTRQVNFHLIVLMQLASLGLKRVNEKENQWLMSWRCYWYHFIYSYCIFKEKTMLHINCKQKWSKNLEITYLVKIATEQQIVEFGVKMSLSGKYCNKEMIKCFEHWLLYVISIKWNYIQLSIDNTLSWE